MQQSRSPFPLVNVRAVQSCAPATVPMPPEHICPRMFVKWQDPQPIGFKDYRVWTPDMNARMYNQGRRIGEEWPREGVARSIYARQRFTRDLFTPPPSIMSNGSLSGNSPHEKRVSRVEDTYYALNKQNIPIQYTTF